MRRTLPNAHNTARGHLAYWLSSWERSDGSTRYICCLLIRRLLFDIFSSVMSCWFWKNWNTGKVSSKFSVTLPEDFLPYIGLHNKNLYNRLFCIFMKETSVCYRRNLLLCTWIHKPQHPVYSLCMLWHVILDCMAALRRCSITVWGTVTAVGDMSCAGVPFSTECLV